MSDVVLEFFSGLIPPSLLTAALAVGAGMLIGFKAPWEMKPNYRVLLILAALLLSALLGGLLSGQASSGWDRLLGASCFLLIPSAVALKFATEYGFYLRNKAAPK